MEGSGGKLEEWRTVGDMGGRFISGEKLQRRWRGGGGEKMNGKWKSGEK